MATATTTTTIATLTAAAAGRAQTAAAAHMRGAGDRNGADIVTVSASGATYDSVLHTRKSKSANERAALAWHAIALALSKAYANSRELEQLYDCLGSKTRERHALFTDLLAPSTATRAQPCDRRGTQVVLAAVRPWLTATARDKTQDAHDSFLACAKGIYMGAALVESAPRAAKSSLERESAALERAIVTVCNALGLAGGMTDAARARIAAALALRPAAPVAAPVTQEEEEEEVPVAA